MVFKKPYAFLIKYFKFINLMLSILLIFLGYKLNNLHIVIRDIYKGEINNYTNFNKTYIGFKMVLLLFIIIIILSFIVLLLNKKKKPLMDYIYSIGYIIIILLYTFIINNLFISLNKTIVEQTKLNVYSGVSLWIIVPIIYFVIKFILIAIGFNLKKFDFTNDIIELKQEEKDNEEVELIFDKNTYKYKRFARRTLRELKYYYLENKIIINIIISIIVVILIGMFFSLSFFKSNKVKLNKSFDAGGLNYKIKNIYETSYDLNNNIIDEEYKFIIAELQIINKSVLSQSIDFNRIRIIYKGKYSYANNYFNKYFYDLGKPYDGEAISGNTSYNYIFIFKVPINYKSNKYNLKIYDKNTYNKDELKGEYKEITLKAKRIDNKRKEQELNLNENVIFNKASYGNSNITIANYILASNYIYEENNIKKVIKDNDINKILLILDYKLELDNDYSISNYFKNNKDFFDKFITITYNNKGNIKTYNKVKCLEDIDGKALLSIPYEVMNSDSLLLNIELRNTKIIYELK